MMDARIVAGLRHRVADYLELRSIRKHRSRLGRAVAFRYSDYLERCRRRFDGSLDVPTDVGPALQEFERKGLAAFWSKENRELATRILCKIRQEEAAGLTPWNDKHQYASDVYRSFPEIEALFRGSLASFLMGCFRTHYKIFYGMLYKSERLRDAPEGSQLWHADGGPGTCIIVMMYLHDVTGEDGALECLPWEYSLATYRNERSALRKRMAAAGNGHDLAREDLRKLKCDYYEEIIQRRYRPYVERPTGRAGLVVAFGNNLLHRGGFPAPGRSRYVCLFHCYPSDRPTPFERYRAHGIPKVESYPQDPAADF